MKRFRDFIRSQPFACTLREDEAAPSPSPEAPDNPETTNKYHFDSLQRELGIDDKAFKGALEGGIQTLYKVPDYGWGFRVQPPIQATVKDMGTEQYQVTFMLKQKKLMNPKSFILPFMQGQRPNYYEGPVEDKTVMMNKEELSDLMVAPYEAAAAQGGMGMPPPGGDPMGGMGAPPAGGAPLGGPPPGGAPMGGI